MFAAKVHILLTILATQGISLYDGRVPYFPIEVSRTAASSDLANTVMGLGFSTLFFTLYETNQLNPVTTLLAVGLCLVAAIKDTESFWGHMFAVGLVFGAACWHLYIRVAKFGIPPSELLVPFLWAMGVWALRIVFRSLAMLYLDPKLEHERVRGTWLGLTQAGFNRTREIMLKGPLAFEKDSDWFKIVPTLQICGVLQWVSFFALSLMF